MVSLRHVTTVKTEVMLHQCPNCREGVSFLRAFRTPAWGSFRCRACGSVLGISFGRRMLAGGIWLAVAVFAMKVLRLYAMGRLVSYGSMAIAFVVIFYLFEKVILLDRRAFTCRQCGYALRGLSDPRCPECGTAFDPAEHQAIQDRITAPPPQPRHRWIAAIVVVLLMITAAAGMLAWQRASRPPPAPAPAPPTAPS